MSCLFVRSTTTTTAFAEYTSAPDCQSIDVYLQNNYWAGMYLAFDTDTANIYLKGLDLNMVKPDLHSGFRNYEILNYSNKNGFSVFRLTKPDYVNANTPGYFGFDLIDQNDFDLAGLGTFTAGCKPLTVPPPLKDPVMPKHDSKTHITRRKCNV